MPGLFEQFDFGLFIRETYFAFLLLGGLLVIMRAYRDVRLPDAGNFKNIVLVLFLMTVANGLERCARVSADGRELRFAMSVVHYCLQPCVIWLELVIIMPEAVKRRRLNMLLLSLPLIFNTAVYLTAPLTGESVIWYSRDNGFHRGPLGFTIYYVTFFYLLLLLLWSIRFLRQNERRKGIVLFFIFAVAVLTGILEGLNLVTGFIDDSFTLGVFLYYIYLVTVHELKLRTSLATKELELSESRVKLLQEQIRPHFIFNSLHIIKALIRTNPAKAMQGVEDFSDYLQANLDVMTSNRLIPFEEELAHVEAFVSLALADESKDITVRYDIEARYFSLPPLTVEPLVENAIQHGVKNGGTVTLATRADDGEISITVSDDGVGMRAAATERAKKRAGISMENVRARLAALCGGTLAIESSDGGTVVTVRIPKKGANRHADPGGQYDKAEDEL